MIVSCPTCSTHYSHSEEDVMQLGRCSRCDKQFPLSGRKRRYVVMPAVRSGAADPLLASGLAETETQVDRRPETAASPADVSVPRDFPLPETPVPPAGEDDGFFGAGTDDDEALFGIDETAESRAEETVAERPARPRKSRPTHPFREAFGVFLLGGLGGAAGFQGSTQFGFEPLDAVAAGLAVGLTLGWAWIRWAERKR